MDQDTPGAASLSWQMGGGGDSLDIKAVKIMLWFYFFEQGLSCSWWFIGWCKYFHLGAVGRGMNSLRHVSNAL